MDKAGWTEIPEGESGAWRVKRFAVDKKAADHGRMLAACNPSYRGRYTPEGTYTAMARNGCTVMSDTPDELRDFAGIAARCLGQVLITGLGLGCAVQYVLNKGHADKVTVVEIDADVIKLVGATLLKHYGNRLKIIHADAMTWVPPRGFRYSVAWHDIWDTICADNLPEMRRLHRRYGRRTDWQGSWCRELCAQKGGQ